MKLFRGSNVIQLTKFKEAVYKQTLIKTLEIKIFKAWNSIINKCTNSRCQCHCRPWQVFMSHQLRLVLCKINCTLNNRQTHNQKDSTIRQSLFTTLSCIWIQITSKQLVIAFLDSWLNLSVKNKLIRSPICLSNCLLMKYRNTWLTTIFLLNVSSTLTIFCISSTNLRHSIRELV